MATELKALGLLIRTVPGSTLVAILVAIGVFAITESIIILIAEIEALEVSLSAGPGCTSVAEVELIGITEEDPSSLSLGRSKL